VLIDTMLVTVSLGALSWVFLMKPYVEDTELGVGVKLLAVAYPALDLVLVVLMLRLAFGSSRFTPAKVLLLAWAALQLAGDAAYGLLALGGRWTLDSPVFLLWMAGFACLAAAALHPTMTDIGVRSRTADAGPGRLRRGFVAVAVLVLRRW
jgi:hypothetical protein